MDVLMCYGVFAPVKHSFLGHACLVFCGGRRLAYLGSETQIGSSELSVFPYEAHPEFHLRVPAIVSAPEKKELISKHLRTARTPLAGFALIMPPVHHAIPKGTMSFCLFGKDGSYPGTGKSDELDHGDSEGTSLNLPLQRGSGDIANRPVFDEVIVPSAQRFKPDIFLASAGLNKACIANIFPGMMVMFWIHLEVFDLQQEHAACLPLILNNWRKIRGGCCVFFLEGGYNLDSVSYSAAGYFHAFIGEKSLASEFDEPAIN
ncbi:hypothetical protein D5086_015304 [Populus alba]|uniref:Uncharacterized protein n=1 Tax=Populus alba TaxID=43335 RepID=A0ACC4BZZ6_POPAL